MIVVKFSTLRGGVFIEVTEGEEYLPSSRCFRFDADGNAEYATHADLMSSNPAPRWFGHAHKESDFTFT